LAVFGIAPISVYQKVYNARNNAAEATTPHSCGDIMSALPRCERRRLGLEEPDWKLHHGSISEGDGTTRRTTRGGGNGRPVLERVSHGHHVPETVVLDSDTTGGDDPSSMTSVADNESSENGTPPAAATAKKKPINSRVIVEVGQLERAFKNFPCPSCEEPLELKIRTVCIASSIELVCNNKECSYISDFERPLPTSIHEADDDKYERMTDYAVNVLYVLGFISVGDGSTEAGRLLGLLGLPNDTTMMNRSFGIIEQRIGRFVRELCDEILTSNMQEEAKLSMNEFDYNVWKMWTEDASLGPIPADRMPQIDASYDMAWQQKGSGHVYNSQSGHGSLFGRYTRKIIGLVVKSKLCSYCSSFKRMNPDDPVPHHQCWKNHEGSSGSMHGIKWRRAGPC
jgi:hypothetical protein